jgi:hypothetical protein
MKRENQTGKKQKETFTKGKRKSVRATQKEKGNKGRGGQKSKQKIVTKKKIVKGTDRGTKKERD